MQSNAKELSSSTLYTNGIANFKIELPLRSLYAYDIENCGIKNVLVTCHDNLILKQQLKCQSV
jgi:hypothetical protein